jgi:hypothetical protein
MDIAFFIDDPMPLAKLETLDPDRDWREFVRGERVWILQSFLRLRAAGHPVRLVDTPPSEGLLVFHTKQRRALRRALLGTNQRVPRVILVAARADNRESLIADFEILQNGRWAAATRFPVHHWPQAALVPRNRARGTRIERMGFKGFSRNLAAPFRGPEWKETLLRRGIEWVEDAVDFSGRGTASARLDWNDYANMDLVLAVRPENRALWASKPATKLINAWHAGVPALLGPEWAYRELRRSELDFIEVSTVREALAAIDRLRENPQLYEAMIRHGRQRAAAITVTTVTARWAEILFDLIPRHLNTAGLRSLRGLPLSARRIARRLERWLHGRPAR